MHKSERLKSILKHIEAQRQRIVKAQEYLRSEPEFMSVFDKPYANMWSQLERAREELYVCIRELEDMH
jgi:enamine deaminase RidA (YjgF/YER057c/UK114 family)